MISIGPTGRIAKGDVLDCNRASLERAIKAYDAQLYLTWNPKKVRGWGCWELRRRSEKTITDIVEYNGATYLKIDYLENHFENSVKDLPYLNYSILDWLQKSDLWKQMNFEHHQKHRLTQWIKDLEDEEKAHKQKLDEKVRKDVVYNMLQEKTAIRQYREAINSGVNPAEIARYWK